MLLAPHIGREINSGGIDLLTPRPFCFRISLSVFCLCFPLPPCPQRQGRAVMLCSNTLGCNVKREQQHYIATEVFNLIPGRPSRHITGCAILFPTVALLQHAADTSHGSNLQTERRGRMVNIPASYLGCHAFKSRPGDRLSWLRSTAVFVSPSRQISE
jgi:hypothetical protein